MEDILNKEWIDFFINKKCLCGGRNSYKKHFLTKKHLQYIYGVRFKM